MGFEYEPDVYVLVFTDKLEGLEVRMSETSLDTLFKVSEMIDELDAIESTRQALEYTRQHVIPFLVECGVGWNMERRGEPVPWSADAVASFPEDVTVAILKGWFAALLGHGDTNVENDKSGETPDFMNDGADEPLEELSETD